MLCNFFETNFLVLQAKLMKNFLTACLLTTSITKANNTKMKPRTVRIYSKANWEGMRHDMQEFQSSFLSTCGGKNTEQLWQEFKGEIDQIVSTHVPTKTLRGKKNLPLVTQELKRKMNLRDHLYQVQKILGKIRIDKSSKR